MNLYYPFRSFFEPLMDAPCPKTEALIKSGFQQPPGDPGDYIHYAKECGIPVDYTIASPPQGWHFIKSYLDRRGPKTARIQSIVCGELMYYLAEVSHSLTEEELCILAEDIKGLKRSEACHLIKERCYPRILETVLNAYNAA